jgi:hypothetical protein
MRMSHDIVVSGTAAEPGAVITHNHLAPLSDVNIVQFK